MTSHAAQAVERERFEALLRELDIANKRYDAGPGTFGELKDAYDAVLAAYDARAESRTAEQGAVATYRSGGSVEWSDTALDEHGFVNLPAGTKLYTASTAVAAATRAAFLKAAQMCEARIGPDDSHNAPYNAEDMACAKAIRTLADALPAEAPEGRETIDDHAPGGFFYVPPVVLGPNGVVRVCAICDIAGCHHLRAASPEAAQRDISCAHERGEDVRGCWNVRCQLGKRCKKLYEAAQPAASKRDIYAFETLLGNLEDEVNAIGSVLGSSVRMRAAHKVVVAMYDAALAQSTHQAPEGEKDAARMDWLSMRDVQVRQPMMYGSLHLFSAYPTGDEEIEAGPSDLRSQVDAALPNKENAE